MDGSKENNMSGENTEINENVSIGDNIADAVESAEQAIAANNEEASEEVEASSEETDEESGEELEASEEETSEAEDGTIDAQAEVELKKMLRKLNLKIDGEEIEEELPFEIPEEHADWYRKQLQLAKVSQKRMQQYSSLENQANSFLEQLKNDPMSLLQDPSLGVDVEAMVEQYINRQIEDSEKSPDQLEREKLQQELEDLRSERNKEKEEIQSREFARLEEQAMESYDAKMTEALEGSNLPKSPYVVKKMADYLLMALEDGYDVDPADVLPLVEQEIQSDIQQMFGAMPDEVFEQTVGKDRLNKIRKKNIESAKKKQSITTAKSIKDTGINSADSEKNAKPKQTLKQFFGV